MAGISPSWFAVDEVFEGRGGWYIGARDGFSIGPYDSPDAAHDEASDMRRRMADAGSVRDVLRVVTDVLERRQDNATRPRTFGRMLPARAGELPRLGYRTPRLFAVYGKWYFTTREGVDVGPYGSRASAERGQRELVVQLQGCDTDRQRWHTIVEFMAAGAGPT